MSPESDLLYAVLALQMNFITKDQMVECGALWASDRKKNLPSILDAKGYLKPSAKTALAAMVEAQMEQYGDPSMSLAALSVDMDIRGSLLDLPLDEKVRGTLMKHVEARRAVPIEPDAMETIVVFKPREEDRYQHGAEIGRGGLGRVVAARDTILERDVAVKEMLRGAENVETLKRFLREGEVAGRLSHPNVIPVHDIGVREDGGGKTPYFVMTRIEGRDLKEIIQAVEKGEGCDRHDFSRPPSEHRKYASRSLRRARAM